MLLVKERPQLRPWLSGPSSLAAPPFSVFVKSWSLSAEKSLRSQSLASLRQDQSLPTCSKNPPTWLPGCPSPLYLARCVSLTAAGPRFPPNHRIHLGKNPHCANPAPKSHRPDFQISLYSLPLPFFDATTRSTGSLVSSSLVLYRFQSPLLLTYRRYHCLPRLHRCKDTIPPRDVILATLSW